MMERLIFISENEGCRFQNNDKMKILNEILEISQGDMRRAVTTLQSVHTLSGTDGVIELDNISEMAGLPPVSVVNTLMQIFVDPKSNFGQLEKTVNDIMLEGYAAQQIMKSLLKKILISDDSTTTTATTSLSEMGKAKIAIKIAEADKNLIDSADEFLQLLSVCSLILQCFKERQ
jgi:replication factor C subunit 2/4